MTTTKRKPRVPATKTAAQPVEPQAFVILADGAHALLDYLARRPYAEVAHLIPFLTSAAPLTSESSPTL